MITFQLEKWSEFVEDAKPLFPLHYAEMALNKNQIKLCLDFGKYEEAERLDQLHLVTARDGRKLVGYWTLGIMNHLHYMDAGLMAMTDMFFILPEYRKGGCGAKLLLEVERTLREKRVVKAYISTKLHQDHSKLFESLGWNATDKVFTKVLI